MLRLTLPDRSELHVEAGAATHPLFGRCDAVWHGGARVGLFASVDWERPDRIPPLDRPGGLPAGAGSAILNALAVRARDAEVPALRYTGPYPTGALFDTLLWSFSVAGDLGAAFARFSGDVEATALSGAPREAPVDFAPDPFSWSWPAPEVCLQTRRGVERVWVRGRPYDRLGGSRRLVDVEGGLEAVVFLAGERWHTVLGLPVDGALAAPPAPLPTVPAGGPLPEPLRAALVTVLVPRGPVLLRPALAAVLEHAPLVWGDAGDEEVALRGGAIVVHGAMRLAGRPDALTALARAVEPVAWRLAQDVLARAHEG